MEPKRIISSLIGFPIVALILVFGNKYVVDVTMCIIAMIALYEYFNAFKDQQQNKNLRWIAYASSLLIAFIHIIPKEYLYNTIIAIIPISVFILFAQIIMTDMKYNIKDISITLFGLCYVVMFLIFISLLRGTENGRITIWYIFIAAWGTDISAYIVGRTIGKHKFSKISPNKSIEGCFGGVIGAVILTLIYTFICNNYLGMNFNYIQLTAIGMVLSLIGQLGDFAASSIKRYAGIKDFSNLIPGHGGMLDRIDSILFVAPFAYFLLTII